MVDALFRRLAERDGYVQRPDRQIAFHAIADGPRCYPEEICVQITQGNQPAGVQTQDHRQIQPAFARPDIADIARLLPAGECLHSPLGISD